MNDSRKIRFRFRFEALGRTCLWLDIPTRKQNPELYETLRYNVHLDKLPLSEETKIKARELDEWHFESIDWGNPGGPSPWTQEEADRFNAAAEELFLKVKAELGDEFEVIDGNYKVIL